MERGNNDMLVFVLVFLFSLMGARCIALVPGLLAVLLKVYPAALVGALLIRKERRLLLWGTPVLALILFLMYDQLAHIRAGVTMGLKLSYGLPHWLFLFNDFRLGAWAPVWLILFTLIAMVLVLRFVMQKNWFTHPSASVEYHLFLSGACIYVFTYALSSNWDYRLIFLNLCIPFLLQDAKRGFEFGCGDRFTFVPLVLIALSMSYVPLDRLFDNAGVLVNLLAKYLLFVGMASALLTLFWHSGIWKIKTAH